MACQQSWPLWSDEFLAQEEVEIVIQINGKLRDKVTVKKNSGKEELEQVALASLKVQEATRDKAIRKIIVVPNKVVNVVIN
jgi:leucyl-tRNA synthetase